MSCFGDRIKELRAERNLSLRQLSKLTGISSSAIHAYEVGKREAGYKSLEALSDVFNCDIDYLLCRTDIRNSVANSLGYNSLYEAHKDGINLQLFSERKTPDELALTEGERLWLELYRRVSPDTRNLLVKLVDSFDGISEEKQKLALQLIRVAFGDLEQ